MIVVVGVVCFIAGGAACYIYENEIYAFIRELKGKKKLKGRK